MLEIGERAAVAIGALAWMAGSYLIAKRKERELKGAIKTETATSDTSFPLKDLDNPMDYRAAGAIAAATLLAALLLTKPWNATVAIAAAGLGVASWCDWRTRMMWDEITVTTMLLCAGIATAAGSGVSSVQGGAGLGLFAAAVYFGGLLIGKESGFGDVKAAAVIGFALGVPAGFAAYFAGTLLTLAAAAIVATHRRTPLSRLREIEIPFGPGLAIGMALAASVLTQIDAFASFAVQ